MATTQYIGSRYVPLFADPIEWSNAKEYEPLTIVTHEGNSYTAKQFVPVGIDISNNAYWVVTGNYNAQIEQYRRDVAALSNHVDTSINELSDTVDDIGAQVQDIVDACTFVETYDELLKTTSNNVCVLNNYSPLGDGGLCFFEKTDFEMGSIERNDGSFVIPVAGQSTIQSSSVPLNDIITCAATYIGNHNLVYGGNTLISPTCTNQIDCSAFVMAVLQGITYENSRYVRGSSSDNLIGAYAGDFPKYNFDAASRMYTWTMAQYYMEHKQFTKFTGNWKTDITLLQPGDVMFATSRNSAADNRLYDIDHVVFVLQTFPNDGAVVIMQCGSAPGTMTNMHNTVGKISVVAFANYDTPDDRTRSSYIGFVRPTYGNGEQQSNESIMKNFHTRGRQVYTEGVNVLTLGNIILTESLDSNTPYTIQIRGRLPKYDVDGCWLVGTVGNVNVARWYHISLYENYAELTFIPSDEFASKYHSMDIGVITQTATEYATYFEITNVDIYKGYAKKTNLPYVIPITLNDTENFAARSQYSWGGLIMPNGDIKIDALLATNSLPHSSASDYPVIKFDVPEKYKAYIGMYNKQVYFQGNLIGGVCSLIPDSDVTNGIILQLTGTLPNNAVRNIDINFTFENLPFGPN